MAGFDEDPLAPGSYSQLLFGDELEVLETDLGFISSFSCDDHNNSKTTIDAPKMLCFGDYAKQFNAKKRGRKSGSPACMDPPSLSSSKKTKKKRDESGIQDTVSCSAAPTVSQRNSKKAKSDNSTTTRHAKVKKEKLGERINALQQLVSPFGKTDTASVLHEALGYIRFLQDQVQVLCSPYLQRCPTSSVTPRGHDDGENITESERRKNDDLISSGLCLVPVELTLHVADSNGADLWSSSAMVSNISSS